MIETKSVSSKCINTIESISEFGIKRYSEMSKDLLMEITGCSERDAIIYLENRWYRLSWKQQFYYN